MIDNMNVCYKMSNLIQKWNRYGKHDNLKLVLYVQQINIYDIVRCILFIHFLFNDHTILYIYWSNNTLNAVADILDYVYVKI